MKIIKKTIVILPLVICLSLLATNLL